MPIARRHSQSQVAAQTSGFHRAAPRAIDYEDLLELPSDLPVVKAPPPASGPRRYASMEMPAVRPQSAHPAPPPVVPLVAEEAPVSGRMLDAAFLEDEVPLALDLAPPPGSHTPVQTLAGAVLPAVWAKSASGLHIIEPKSIDPWMGVVAFAGFGLPPQKLSATPAYAFRVITRKITLRSDLKIARMRRLPQRDIELYEAAISCADEGAVTRGIALVATTLAGSVSAIAAAIALLF